MTASAICLVNSTSLGRWVETTNGAVEVVAGEEIQVRLANHAAGIWSVDVHGADDVVVAPTITQAANPMGIATFTAPATPTTGWALLIRSRIGFYSLGYDSNGIEQPEFTATFKLVTLTGNGLQLLTSNETSEGDPETGIHGIIDQAIRNTTGGTGSFSGDALSFRGVSLSATASTEGQVYVRSGSLFVPKTLTQDDIGPAFAVSTFAATTATVEVGATVATPAFTASYSTTPDSTAGSVVMTNDDNSESLDVSATPTSFASTESYTESTDGAAVTFTLTAKKGTVTRTGTATIAWRQYAYWGVAGSTINEAGIEALANNALASGRARTFTISAGAGEYVWYCFRAAYGIPSVTIGGFNGGVEDPVTVSVTNANGVTENYYAIRTVNPNLGSNRVFVWS